MSKKIVVGVDVGHGNTKIASKECDQEVTCSLIPSRAPRATTTDLSGGTVHSRNTVLVSVNGQEYEVGSDVDLSVPTVNAPILNERYTTTAEYMALFKGALHVAEKSTIDLLVTGLPVSQLTSKSKTLAAKLKGNHDIGNSQVVTVKNVLIIAQPVGGLIDYAISNNLYNEVRVETNLIIDMGFFTLDWVVARGIQPNAARSGTYAGGMYKLLKNITLQTSDEYNTDYNNYSSVDNGLCKGNFRIFGNKVELTTYIENARHSVSVHSTQSFTPPDFHCSQ